MKRPYVIVCLAGLVALMLAGTPPAWAEEPPYHEFPPLNQNQALMDYLNARPPFQHYAPWALFLGAGVTQEEARRIERLARELRILNPFNEEKPFPQLQVFAFGQQNLPAEVSRLATDHFEIPVLSSWEELAGYRFDYAICHSNGCTNALSAHRQGIIRAENFITLGTDWTFKDVQPGDLKGAKVWRFVTKWDPIAIIPAPSWTMTSEETVGLVFSKRFGPGVESVFPIIVLDPPDESKGSIAVHYIFQSYFPAITKWLASPGLSPEEAGIRTKLLDAIHQRGGLPAEDDDKRITLPPGGGGSGPGGGLEQPPQSSGGGMFPSVPHDNSRGGISAGIIIRPDDFESR